MFGAVRMTQSTHLNGQFKSHIEREFSSDGQDFADAAVLVPVIAEAGELALLLTERASHLKHHAGQISFPGGRADPGDVNLDHTALREAHEEIGLSPDDADIIGRLPRLYTISFYDVSPVVALVRDGFEAQPAESEVASVFTVPISFLMQTQNHVIVEREVGGKILTMTEFHYNGYRIWGATAAMIQCFIGALQNPSPL